MDVRGNFSREMFERYSKTGEEDKVQAAAQLTFHLIKKKGG
jgi:hypothetical protein